MTRVRRLAPYLFVPLMLHFHAPTPPPLPTPAQSQPSAPSTTLPVAAPLVTATARAEWTLVARCETGGDWTMHGPVYSGALGISNVNWTAYSVGLGYPATAGTATETQQIVVAERVQASAGLAGVVPDRGYCASW